MVTRATIDSGTGFAAVLLTCAVLAGGSHAGEADILRRSNSGEPGTLDPHLGRSTAELIIINDLFTGLLTQDAHGRVVPGAASGYSVSADGLTWTFTLREDLKWSDGTPMSSADFLYSFRRSMDPETASPGASLLYPIRNARAVNSGEMTPEELGVSAPEAGLFIVELERPIPYFDRLMLMAAALPVPRHAIGKFGRRWSRPPNAVSNGAFVLTQWTPRVHVQAEKNVHFHEQESVRLQGVRYLPTEDLSTQLKRFRAGEIDLGLNFPPSQAAWVRNNLAGSVRIFPIYGTYYYPINLSLEKFSDVRTRRALNISIDREAIAVRLLGSGERPAWSMVPPGFEFYPPLDPPRQSALPLEERQAIARKLLADAGFGPSRPLEVEIRYNMTEEHQAVAVAIAGMWKAVGIRASVLSTESRTHFRDLALGEFEVGRSAAFASYADPSAFLVLFSAENRRDNYAGYSNAMFDRLIGESNRIFDPRLRAATLREAEALALSEYPVIPIYHYVSKRLVSPRVKGWQDNPAGAHLSRYLALGEAS